MSWDIPLTDVVFDEEDLEAVARLPALGLADDGPAHEGVRGGGRGATAASPHAVAVSSGTAALHLAVRGARPRPRRRGDRPALHVPGDGQRAALRRRDARAVRRRRRRTRRCIDAEDVERKLTPRTKAVIAVHMLGYPAATASCARCATRTASR